MSLINSLHSFFLKLSRPATIAAITVITLLFLWFINFQGVPGIPPIASLLRIGLPDMMFAYSPSTIYEKLVLFGADGRSAYRIFLERVDFLFPAVYGLFFVTVTTFGFSALFPNRPALQKLSLLPLLTTLFDYAENLCSSPSSEAFRWSCQTWKSSPTYSPWPSGLSPQSVSYCCSWQLWVC